MSHSNYTTDEIVQRGQAIYEEQIRPKLSSEEQGKFLVVDIETGEFETDNSELAALKRAKIKNPDAALFLLRVGSTTAYRLGGTMLAEKL